MAGLAACGGGGGGGGDDDVSDLCGNGVMDPGESCDDSNTADGDGCDSHCVLEAVPTSYRVSTMTLADPHPMTFGLDVHGTVDMLLTESLTMDKTMPADGKLDLSIVPVFRPLAQGDGATTPLDIVFADCTVPVESTQCTRPATGTVVTTTATNAAGTCLEPMAGTTGGYDPAVITPSAPCFSSAPASFEVTLGSVVLPLKEARIAATYVGNPATSLTDGLIAGFVTKTDADAIILPADLLVVGGMPLSALLKPEDMDTGPGGAQGWWFYINFTAEPVAYAD